MRPAAIVFVALLASVPSSWANSIFPTLFAGTGIADGEVIDIRVEPDENAPIIAHIPSDSRDIEVVARDGSGEWGRVNHAEASGWLSMARVREQNDVWPASGLPKRTTCYGTEPFWSLQTNGKSADFSTPDAGGVALPVTGVLTSGTVEDQRRVIIVENETLALTVSLSPRACSDGMSDRVFGLTAHVIRESGPMPDLLRGCCTIAP